MFKPILEEDGIALEAELLGYVTHWDAPLIELNPVMPMFQKLTALKWESYLERAGKSQTACAK